MKKLAKCDGISSRSCDFVHRIGQGYVTGTRTLERVYNLFADSQTLQKSHNIKPTAKYKKDI